MTGVPATTDMHFRNGAVAISYMSTLLLHLVDEKKVSLDDKVSKWLPDMPHADRVTLGQLAQMTSGYIDFVIGNTAIRTRRSTRTRSGSGRPRNYWHFAVDQAAALRTRHELELRPHQLRHPRAGAGEDHRSSR